MNLNAIFIIMAAILWGIISLFVNALKDIGFNSIQCVTIRVFFAAFIMIVYLLIKDKKLLKIHLKDISYFIGTGILSIVFFNYCYFEAIELIGGVAVPALLLYTAPIFVMILSCIIFKEKITKKKFCVLIITFIGLGFVTGAFTGKGKIPFIAFIFGLGAGFGYALYSIFGKILVKKYNVLTITTYTFVFATIGVIPISLIWNDISLLINLKGISISFGLAFLSTILPFLFYTKGLNGIEAGKASILATIEPLVATFIGAIFYNEQFDIFKIIGMLLIFTAIIILNIRLKKVN